MLTLEIKRSRYIVLRSDGTPFSESERNKGKKRWTGSFWEIKEKSLGGRGFLGDLLHILNSYHKKSPWFRLIKETLPFYRVTTSHPTLRLRLNKRNLDYRLRRVTFYTKNPVKEIGLERRYSDRGKLDGFSLRWWEGVSRFRFKTLKPLSLLSDFSDQYRLNGIIGLRSIVYYQGVDDGSSWLNEERK